MSIRRPWRDALVIRAVVLLLLAAGSAFLVRTFVAAPFAVPSRSMMPALLPGDSLLVVRTALLGHGFPARGDIIVFRDRSGGFHVKRVAGVPGDTVSIAGGRLSIDGRPVLAVPIGDDLYRETLYPDETHLVRTENDINSQHFGPFRVPAGHFFLLGDNRGLSDDSRDYGPVARAALVGRPVILFFSAGKSIRWSRIGRRL